MILYQEEIDIIFPITQLKISQPEVAFVRVSEGMHWKNSAIVTKLLKFQDLISFYDASLKKNIEDYRQNQWNHDVFSNGNFELKLEYSTVLAPILEFLLEQLFIHRLFFLQLGHY